MLWLCDQDSFLIAWHVLTHSSFCDLSCKTEQKQENIIPPLGWCDATIDPFDDAPALCFIVIGGFSHSCRKTEETLFGSVPDDSILYNYIYV